MRRSLLIAMMAAVMLITMAAPIFAGEITGKGKDTPIGTYEVNNSICAFSGLQDDEGVSGPGHVQTPHGEPDLDLFFPPGIASVCQWINNSAGHSNRPQEPPPLPE